MLNRALNRREQHWRKGKRRYNIFFPLALMSKICFALALTSINLIQVRELGEVVTCVTDMLEVEEKTRVA